MIRNGDFTVLLAFDNLGIIVSLHYYSIPPLRLYYVQNIRNTVLIVVNETAYSHCVSSG